MELTDLFKDVKFIKAKKPSPYLMIVLHGKGDSIKPFTEFDRELKLSEMNFLLINAPKKFLNGWSWYGDPPYQKKGVENLRKKIIQLLVRLEEQNWKSENIFLFGFSQGCLVSADVALHHQRKLAGVIGISGYFQFYPRWRQRLTTEQLKTPWLFTHGVRDSTLKYETTHFGAHKLKDAGFEVEWKKLNKGHSLLESEYPLIRKWLKEKMKFS